MIDLYYIIYIISFIFTYDSFIVMVIYLCDSWLKKNLDLLKLLYTEAVTEKQICDDSVAVTLCKAKLVTVPLRYSVATLAL